MEKELKYPIKAEIEKIHPTKRAEVRRKIMARCDIGRATLSEYENINISDSRKISVDHLMTMADVLNCPVQNLLPKPKPTNDAK